MDLLNLAEKSRDNFAYFNEAFKTHEPQMEGGSEAESCQNTNTHSSAKLPCSFRPAGASFHRSNEDSVEGRLSCKRNEVKLPSTQKYANLLLMSPLIRGKPFSLSSKMLISARRKEKKFEMRNAQRVAESDFDSDFIPPNNSTCRGVGETAEILSHVT